MSEYSMDDLASQFSIAPKSVMHWQPADTFRISDTYQTIRNIVNSLRDVERGIEDCHAFRDLVEHARLSHNLLLHIEQEVGNRLREQTTWEARH